MEKKRASRGIWVMEPDGSVVYHTTLPATIGLPELVVWWRRVRRRLGWGEG
jgi:hypothetical protein